MRICLYTATALPKLGGQEAVVDALARHFISLGHEAVVLAPRPRKPLKPQDRNFPYPVVRHPRFFSTRDFVSWYRYFLSSAHARHRFDVIHCHDVYPTGYLAALCRRRLRVPVVITSHGGDVRDNNARLTKRGLPERCAMALRAADALISIGPFTEQGFRRIYPDAPRIVTIPNGIDLTLYETPAPRPPGLDAAIRSGGYVLFLGRLARRKGVDLLLDALARVPPDGTVQCVIAGSGDEASDLREHARKLGLTDRVRFVGRVDAADKIYLLQNARCSIMPSRVWEAFPLVLLETYAAGRPVVGSAVPGIVDLVREGETGRLFPDENAAALAAVLAQTMSDSSTTEVMGRQAKLVAQSYSWDAVARRHIELYEQVVGECRLRGRKVRAAV